MFPKEVQRNNTDQKHISQKKSTEKRLHIICYEFFCCQREITQLFDYVQFDLMLNVYIQD